MSVSGVTAAELLTMIADTEAMRDQYIGGSSYYYAQYAQDALWLRAQLRAMESSP